MAARTGLTDERELGAINVHTLTVTQVVWGYMDRLDRQTESKWTRVLVMAAERVRAAI